MYFRRFADSWRPFREIFGKSCIGAFCGSGAVLSAAPAETMGLPLFNRGDDKRGLTPERNPPGPILMFLKATLAVVQTEDRPGRRIGRLDAARGAGGPRLKRLPEGRVILRCVIPKNARGSAGSPPSPPARPW